MLIDYRLILIIDDNQFIFIITKIFMIDCPSIININRLIDNDCHRLLSIAIDYRFQRLFRSCSFSVRVTLSGLVKIY